MVVGALFEQFAPSHRGLMRNDPNDSSVDLRELYQTGDDYDTRAYRNLPVGDGILDTTVAGTIIDSPPKPATTRKRKQFRATKLLMSIAADFDVVSDWIFFFHTRGQDQQYRAELNQNLQNENTQPYLIPPWFLSTILFVCILSTAMWLVLATEGAVIAPCLRRLNIDKFSMGYALFLSVLVEDIPQVILTFLAEDYYEDGHQFNSFAMINVIASLYDTLIKLAEAFDDRGDIIETGIWCKDSLHAHNNSVTDISVVSLASSSRRTSSSRVHVNTQRGGASRRSSVFEDLQQITSETKLPRIRFLSASKDRTVRLWDTEPEQTSKQQRSGRKLVRSISSGHLKAITCITYLGKIVDDGDLINRSKSKIDGDDDSQSFFLTGSEDGMIKLYNLTGKCLRTYFYEVSDEAGITSIASVVSGETFISGYRTGSTRLWEIWSGACLAKYEGHSKKVNSVCSLEDGRHFLSASDDKVIRLWDANEATQNLESSRRSNELGRMQIVEDNFKLISDEPGLVEKVSIGTFVGHSGAVLSLACVEANVAFISGSEDQSARLWSVESKACLRIFSGHAGPVTSVATVDSSTFLTGSEDTTIKVWDAFTTGAVRTYRGHRDTVTSVSMAEDGTFISSSKDATVKLWVFTAVTPTQYAENLPELLGMNGDCTCGAYS